MRICVVGMGKIGLPLAVQYARKGHNVFGADVNPVTVGLINAGSEPFPGEAHLAELLPQVVSSGHLTVTTDTTAAVSESEAVVVVVPLFVDEEAQPEFGWMDAATTAIGHGLRAGTLVSYETTLPVGTTRTRFAPRLAELSGLEPGHEFHLVFSPERVLTGRVFADLRKYPKLVGGFDAASEARGVEFYEAVLDFDERVDLPRPNGVWAMGSAEAAEMAKLAETTYRDVNIGLANQFAKFADQHGIDVYAVIEACNSQPYSHIHQPGIAVGGHCIPVYPRLYLHNDPNATIVRAAREANLSMPEYAVERLREEYGELVGARVAVLGLTYRAGVKETAFSGALDLVRLLSQRQATALVHDPMYSANEIRGLGFEAYEFGMPVDAIIIQTDHREYQDLAPADVPGCKIIVDGRRTLTGSRWTKATQPTQPGSEMTLNPSLSAHRIGHWHGICL
jgi:nucleotide sugar dehydrogenase